jgi:hypothetical protein
VSVDCAACHRMLLLTALCRFEKEVEALRKELAEASARSGPSTPGLSEPSSPQITSKDLPVAGTESDESSDSLQSASTGVLETKKEA